MADAQIPQKTPLGGLARKLVQMNLISELAALTATEASAAQNIPFVTSLVANQLINPRLLATVCSQEFGLPVFDLSGLDYAYVPKELLKPQLITQLHAFPNSFNNLARFHGCPFRRGPGVALLPTANDERHHDYDEYRQSKRMVEYEGPQSSTCNYGGFLFERFDCRPGANDAASWGSCASNLRVTDFGSRHFTRSREQPVGKNRTPRNRESK